MALSRSERERITDSLLKIQSARASLDRLDESKVPKIDEIQDCLKSADENLSHALRRF